ncbi:MAG TPA: DHHA1 domain-containing protein [Phototrophicaceae bacterium]|nr:DHHA1 domain-containing protein [Phototrophicaceae bacterium]
MTTQRLYYEDAYTVDFTAQVLERLAVNGQPAVILDKTYFYPASGGQPADFGTINGAAVVDLQTREGDGAVLHILEGEVAGDQVECQINWERRFDHMQHHTGQHILTQAFVQVAGANTVGFHLSPDSVTIDLDTTSLSAEIMTQVESLANRTVWENHPVVARLVQPDEADGVRMRRMPGHLLTDGLRVMEIDGFDSTACGGTHVAHTGEIGLIKVLKLERRGDKTRVEFRCGGRAFADYQQKNVVVNGLVAGLTCRPEELEPAVTRLQEDLKTALRDLKAAKGQLLEYEAERLLREAPEVKGVRIVKKVFEDRDVGELKLLAGRLIETSGVVVLFGLPGEKANLILARSKELTPDMNALIKQVLPVLGAARGGGQPSLAQGGGVPANAMQVQSALDAAETILLNP